MKQLHAKLIILLGICILISCFFAFGLYDFFTLDYLQSRHSIYKQYYEHYPTLTLVLYFLIYVGLTAMSIPCLSIVILAGGALFGFPVSLLIISFADVLGSTLAFLSSRSLFGNYLQNRHPSRLRAVNHGVTRKGGFYLLYLRLIPLFPCFLINLLMGLTKIRTSTFYWATQLGKLPHNALYANAGTQVSNLDSLYGIFSPGIIGSFALIGLFPLIVKIGLQQAKNRRTICLPQENQI